MKRPAAPPDPCSSAAAGRPRARGRDVRSAAPRPRVKSLQVLSEHKSLKFLYVNGSPLEGDFGATAVVTKNGTKLLGD